MKYKTERAWYGSSEHLETEMSWADYKKMNTKKGIKKIKYSLGLGKLIR
jgi:hypothetical protein